jgi:hypothetical protein
VSRAALGGSASGKSGSPLLAELRELVRREGEHDGRRLAPSEERALVMV